MLTRQGKWRVQETINRATRCLLQSWRSWWESALAWYRQHSTNGQTAVEATMILSHSEPSSEPCGSSSTELKAETSSPVLNSNAPLQDSKIASASSSGPSSPATTIVVDGKHATIALILASAACGAILLAASWLPYMLTASAAKADARAQQSITTSELAKRDLEDLKREFMLYKEKQEWAVRQ